MNYPAVTATPGAAAIANLRGKERMGAWASDALAFNSIAWYHISLYNGSHAGLPLH
jgi:hypothetical protein